MTLSFNLIEQPFIPCVRLDGQAAEYGLQDVLLSAQEIAELRDGSPLVTVALHRLLLAVLHSCFRRPKNSAERVALRQAGRFDADRIICYLEKWADRFDLFHLRYPFYQRAGYTQDVPSPANRLVKELSRGNNPILFDHTTDDPPLALTPAQAARAVITEHLFAYSAGRGRKGEPHTLDGPIGRAAEAFALGDSLFETLWLNSTVYDGEEKPIPCSEEDGPIWERTPSPPYGDSATPRGYLDYLTWQSRTLRLDPETEEGRTVIRRAYYSQGRVWKPAGAFYDPFVAYERVAGVGDRAIQLRDNRDLWRDSAALFQFGETDQFRGPTCLHTLGQLVSQGHLSHSDRYRIMVAGARVESGQPNVLFWRQEALPLPLAYLGRPELVESLKHALGLAESVASDALWPAARAAVANWLTANAGMQPDTKRIRAIVDSFAPERLYWSSLERPFRELLLALAEEGADLAACIRGWYWDTLHRTARYAFEQSIGRIDGGRDLKAVNAGRGLLFSCLKKVRKDTHIPDREKEGVA
jgi:CRISPR system Cascade subunit CasA